YRIYDEDLASEGSFSNMSTQNGLPPLEPAIAGAVAISAPPPPPVPSSPGVSPEHSHETKPLLQQDNMSPSTTSPENEQCITLPTEDVTSPTSDTSDAPQEQRQEEEVKEVKEEVNEVKEEVNEVKEEVKEVKEEVEEELKVEEADKIVVQVEETAQREGSPCPPNIDVDITDVLPKTKLDNEIV
ncbi:hypothetical protein CAPTEDRAFT_202262, partial [Capitella teleta]